MRKVLNLAIIGNGRWGQNLIREFEEIRKNEGTCRIIAVVTTGKKENIQKLTNDFPLITHSTNFSTTINDPEIDAVVIATPTRTHFDLAYQALQQGKHVLVEKPPSQTLSEIESLIKLARKHKKILYPDHLLLHHQLIIRLKELIGNKKPETIFSEWTKRGSFDGDIFEDLAYHDVYVAQFLFGDVYKVELLSKKSDITANDKTVFKLIFKNGLNYRISIDRTSQIKSKQLFIDFSNFEYIWEDKILYRLDKSSGARTVVDTRTVSPLSKMCRAFIQAIQMNENLNETHKLMKKTVKIVSQLKEQATTLPKL